MYMLGKAHCAFFRRGRFDEFLCEPILRRATIMVSVQGSRYHLLFRLVLADFGLGLIPPFGRCKSLLNAVIGAVGVRVTPLELSAVKGLAVRNLKAGCEGLYKMVVGIVVVKVRAVRTSPRPRSANRRFRSK